MSYGMFTGALSRGRSTRLNMIFALAVTAAALLALAISAGSASAAFVANGYVLGASSTQAGSHPAVTLSASNDATQANKNNDDLRTLEFELPTGMLLNPKAVPTPCPTTTFNSGTCSAQTKVGSLSVTYRVGISNYTVAGTVFSITPEAGSLINFGLVVNASSKIQKFLIKGGKAVALSKVRPGLDKEYGTTITIPEIPYKVKSNIGLSTDITISNLALTLDSRSGFTSYPVPSFVTAPTRCDVAVSEARFLSYLDVTATRSSSYTPTGCNSVKSEPSFDIAATNTKAGQATGFSATVFVPNADQDLPIQHSHIKRLAVDLEDGTTVNTNTLNALSLCSEAQLSSDVCPAASKIGTATLAVSLLAGPMTGDIYLTSRDTIKFGYVLRGSNGTKMILRGSLDVTASSYTGAGVRANFETLPQVPWTSANLNFTSNLVNNPTQSCPNATAWAEINGYAGNAMLHGTFYSQTGCAPDTTITSPTPPVTRNRMPITHFSATPSEGSTFECQTDYAGFTPCTSPNMTSRLSDGPHTVSIRAVNGGTADPSPAQYGFTVDSTPPVLAITSPTNDQVLTDGVLQLNFLTESGVTTTCRVDSGAFSPCSSPATFAGLADGSHTVTVIARDAIGNPATSTRSFTVATVPPPVVDITSPQERIPTLTDRVYPEFTVSSPSGAAIVKTECSYHYIWDDPDGYYEGGRKSCKSGDYLGSFTTGNVMRLEVEATDANGKVGMDYIYFIPGQRAPIAPYVVNHVGSGRLTNRLPSFELEYLDTAMYPDAQILCSLTLEGDPVDFKPCGTGSNLPNYQVTTPLTDGEWDFRTRATDGVRTASDYGMGFSVGNWNAEYNVTSSTQQAGAHPDLDITIDPTEAGQLRAADIRFPKGLIGSLNSFPKCDDIVTGVCPEETKIGTVIVDYQIGGLRGLRPTPGDVYLTGPQADGDIAGIVIRVYGPVDPFADVIIPLHLQLVNNAQQMRAWSDSIPTLVGNIDDETEFTEFWVNKFDMHLNGSAGSPYPLMTNPSRCTPGQFSATFGDTEGNSTPEQTIAYQATNCAALPFAPTITQTFPNAAASTRTGVITDVTLPLGNSTISTLSVSEPPAFAPNFPSFGAADDRCPGSAAPDANGLFDANECPSSAIVGEVSVESPLLTEPLTGQVFLINKQPLPYLGITLEGQGISMRLYGETDLTKVNPACGIANPNQFCQKRITVVFRNIPDLPLSSIHMDLNKPDRPIGSGSLVSSKLFVAVAKGDALCTATSPVDSVFSPHSGGTDVTSQQAIPIAGC